MLFGSLPPRQRFRSAYIIGYPDGIVRPEENLTRAEAATIFFRIVTKETREGMWSKTNGFTDVKPDDWYNNAISTLTNGGVLKGYADGSFAPDNSITRAEFAAIAAKFETITNVDVSSISFSDISGHWAENDIKIAVELGYAEGYEDGSFRPDTPISRAEAIAFINNALNRHVEAGDDLLDNMVTWPDNTAADKWYYLAIQEATNSHNYKRKDDGVHEIWTELQNVPDWAALERPDSESGNVNY